MARVRLDIIIDAQGNVTGIEQADKALERMDKSGDQAAASLEKVREAEERVATGAIIAGDASAQLMAAQDKLSGAQERLAAMTAYVDETERMAAEGKTIGAERGRQYAESLQRLEEAEHEVAEVEKEVTAAQKEHAQAMSEAKKAAQELQAAYGTLAREAAIAGGVIVATIGGAALAAGKYGQELIEASEKTGIAVEEISALRYAAEQSGMSLSQLEAALGGMARGAQSVMQSSAGSDRLSRAYERIGVSVADANGKLKDSGELLPEIADGLARVTSGTERAALAQTIFGVSGREMLPLLSEGSKGMQEMAQRAEALGVVWRQQDAQAAREFMNALQEVKTALGSMGRALLGGDEEARKFLTRMAEGIGIVSRFAREHSTAAKIVAGLGLAFGGVLLFAATAYTGITKFIAIMDALVLITGRHAGAVAAETAALQVNTGAQLQNAAARGAGGARVAGGGAGLAGARGGIGGAVLAGAAGGVIGYTAGGIAMNMDSIGGQAASGALSTAVAAGVGFAIGGPPGALIGATANLVTGIWRIVANTEKEKRESAAVFEEVAEYQKRLQALTASERARVTALPTERERREAVGLQGVPETGYGGNVGQVVRGTGELGRTPQQRAQAATAAQIQVTGGMAGQGAQAREPQYYYRPGAPAFTGGWAAGPGRQHIIVEHRHTADNRLAAELAQSPENRRAISEGIERSLRQ